MRTNLELFLIALVQAGVRTPYDMMSKADVSLGSSLPALNRLVKTGLLGVSEGDSRGKRIFNAKGVGSVLLSREWKKQTNAPQKDLDSILRMAALAWARGGEEKCGEFLKKCGGSLKKKLYEARHAVSEERPGNRSGLVERYRWLRRSVELARSEAEIAAVFALAREISPRKSKQAMSRRT